MSNVIEEIDKFNKELNKNPEYRKEQLRVSYTLLKDRVYHLFEEENAIKHEIEKLLNKAESEGDMKDLVNDIILLESSMHN